jgi:hypothetical protein
MMAFTMRITYDLNAIQCLEGRGEFDVKILDFAVWDRYSSAVSIY